VKQSHVWIGVVASLASAVACASDALGSDAAGAAAATVTVLQCGHLIDPVAGKTLGSTTIVIDGSRVREVVSGVQAPAGAKVIDLATQTSCRGSSTATRI
jgi:hypothetical protein